MIQPKSLADNTHNFCESKLKKTLLKKTFKNEQLMATKKRLF